MAKASGRRSRGPRPFLKWAGGKGQLLEQFEPLLPGPDVWDPSRNRYYEPFLGGAALFFSVQPRRAFLSDVNEPLIDCYRAVREDADSVIRHLRRHRYDEEYYYALRARNPARLSLAGRAAYWLYLNKTCFNGLWRVNRRGKFNVPFGRYANPTICDVPNLRAAGEALSGARIRLCCFRKATRSARAGDFVYFDPPYHPVSDTATFTQYTAGAFDHRDQEDLADLARALDQRGCLVMLSNSDVPFIRDLYRGRFHLNVVRARRAINASASKRGCVSELVITNYSTSP